MRHRRLVSFFSAPLLLLAVTAGSARADILIDNSADPLLTGLRIPANAATAGMWSPLKDWPLVGLHTSLMPSGAVMTYGTPLGNGVQDGRTFDIWDPALGLVPEAHYTLPQAQNVDSFCSAGTFLKTGAMLISGGSSNATGYSSKASTLFDPATQTASGAIAAMNAQRWYGSMITAADGRAVMLGGGKPYAVDANTAPDTYAGNGSISMTPEVYDPATGKWTLLTGATSRLAFGPDDNRWWYPRAWVAPSGKIFGLSANRMWSLDLSGKGSITDLGTFKAAPGNGSTTPNNGSTSTAVMYAPGKILQVGGNGVKNGQATVSSNQATVFDITGSSLKVTDTAPMTYPRQWASSIVTPDGKVVITGGSKYADDAGSSAVYPAEIWDPSTGRWTVGAPAAVYRGYHSATLLLPNGAILSTGGGVPGPTNNFNAEIYYPPYLFSTKSGTAALAARPTVYSITGNAFDYGARASLTLTQTMPIGKVVLVGVTSDTHSFNSGQRYVPLTFRPSGNRITVVMPSSRNIAPPGYYMLFVVNASGVPSRGIILSLGSEWKAPVARPAQPQIASGRSISLRPNNYPADLVRHQNYQARIDEIGTSSPALAKLDAAFTVRDGLADSSCRSFESRNFPGYFLRVENGNVYLRARDASTDYANAATFCVRNGLSGSGISLESRATPGSFLRHANYLLRLDRFDGTDLFKADSSFTVIDSLL